jgi:hypothetical protein
MRDYTGTHELESLADHHAILYYAQYYSNERIDRSDERDILWEGACRAVEAYADDEYFDLDYGYSDEEWSAKVTEVAANLVPKMKPIVGREFEGLHRIEFHLQDESLEIGKLIRIPIVP